MLPKITYMGSCGYYQDMPKIFKASDINLNISLKIIQSGMSLRMLDIMGAGGFLLSNYQMELAEYFVDGEEMVLYESIEDAYAKASFYSAHPEFRTVIAKNGFRKVNEFFTYDTQIKAMFEVASIL